MQPLTITPSEVRASERSDWLDAVADYVRSAVAQGATVTLTSKRQMLTPAQVADAIGVSRSTISRRIAAGELRAVKVGNRNRIPYEEFERFWWETMGDVVDFTRDDLRADLLGDRWTVPSASCVSSAEESGRWVGRR